MATRGGCARIPSICSKKNIVFFNLCNPLLIWKVVFFVKTIFFWFLGKWVFFESLKFQSGSKKKKKNGFFELLRTPIMDLETGVYLNRVKVSLGVRNIHKHALISLFFNESFNFSDILSETQLSFVLKLLSFCCRQSHGRQC